MPKTASDKNEPTPLQLFGTLIKAIRKGRSIGKNFTELLELQEYANWDKIEKGDANFNSVVKALPAISLALDLDFTSLKNVFLNLCVIYKK